MSYKYSFADNEVYSASDVNEITKRLVSSGVADEFSDGVAYNASHFNELMKPLYVSGVVPSDCFTLKVTALSENEIMINPGLAFFDSGATFEIDPGGETLTYTLGVKNYVYLKNELHDKNICYPYCGTQAPSGDYVLLAEIDEAGVITDKRQYARGKMPGYQSYADSVLCIDENVEVTIQEPRYAKSTVEFDIGENNFQYILVHRHKQPTGESAVLSLYSIKDEKIISFVSFHDNEAALTEKYIHLNCNNGRREARAKFSLKNGILTIELTVISDNDVLGTIGDTTTEELHLMLI